MTLPSFYQNVSSQEKKVLNMLFHSFRQMPVYTFNQSINICLIFHTFYPRFDLCCQGRQNNRITLYSIYKRTTSRKYTLFTLAPFSMDPLDHETRIARDRSIINCATRLLLLFLFCFLVQTYYHAYENNCNSLFSV